MVNFWSRLSTGKPSKISVTLFHRLKQKKDTGLANLPWYTKVVNTINNCGLGFLLKIPSENLDPRNVKAVLRDRVSAIECQDWHSAGTDSGACSTYKTFKTNLKRQQLYVDINVGTTNYQLLQADIIKLRKVNEYAPSATLKLLEMNTTTCSLAQPLRMKDQSISMPDT